MPEPSKPPRTPLIILIGATLLFVGSAVWFGMPQVRSAAEQGRISRARAQLATFIEATQAYRDAFGALPEGTASEIAASLLGDNPQNKAFLQVTADRTNAQGQLIDPWGTAWEIWRVGEDRLEARSAGPNLRFGDHDDLVASQAMVQSLPKGASPSR